MERTATAREVKRAGALRLPAGFEPAQVEVEGAVRALRILIAAVTETIARKEASRSPRRDGIRRRGLRLGREQAA